MVKWLSILTFSLFGIYDSYGQSINLNKSISFNYQNKALGVILKKLEKKHQLKFSYSNSLLPLKKKITLKVQKKPLKLALNQLFSPLQIRYALIGNQIVLKKTLVNKSSRSYLSFDNPSKKSTTIPIKINLLDASTSNPIPKVHIFKNDTLLVGTSTPEGIFQLNLFNQQEIELVFTHVGYETVRRTINPITKKQYALWMIPKVEKLEGVTISINRDKRWKKLFNKFKTDFLGSSSNASQCKILNPWVVEFVETKKGIKLKRGTQDTLEIENYALGYNLLFLLSNFSLENNDVYYKGQCWFSALAAKNKKQTRRWTRNRKRAYKGSFQHFLAALASRRVTKEGFEFQVSKYPPYKSNGLYFKVPIEQILRPGKKVDEYILMSPYYIKVVYYGELEEYNYLKWYKRSNPWVRGHLKPRAQLSWLWLGSGAIAFNDKGNILNDADKVIRYGYWAWERVGEMLPANYLSEAYQKLTQRRKK